MIIFFKENTAYEMRISDWSADVCSSDLRVASMLAGLGQRALAQQKRLLREWEDEPLDVSLQDGVLEFGAAFDTGEPGRSAERRVGTECACSCRSRWSPYNVNTKSYSDFDH